MLLIMALSFFLPAGAIVPVHAVIQLASNSSRVVLDWRAAHMAFIRQHLVGSIVGIVLAFLLFQRLNLNWLPLLIALYILLHVWVKPFSEFLARFESLYVLGALQTGISLFAGAPGPIPMPYLIKHLPDRHQVVITLAVFMTVGHLLKLLIFLASGFDFLAYWREIIAMVSTAILGSYIGTKLRYRLAAERFLWIAKGLLTLLAIAAIFRVLTVQLS